MAAPIEAGSRTTTGSYTLPVPSWSDVMDFVIVSGGRKGSDGTPYVSGSRGDNGDVLFGSVKVRPGLSLVCFVGGSDQATTINFVSATMNADSGPEKSSNTVTLTGALEGDPAVPTTWAVDIGTRGNGGAGGAKGDFTTTPSTPGEPGSPGTGGGIFWRFRQAAQVPRLGLIRAQDVKIQNKQVQAIYVGTKKVWDKSLN
ncbi:minor tail protein [Gordonia phage Ranch]|uniref:Uncharacterized protein n=1 Tax=Gordonia phage Ranch TaxID=2599848 RepID=A0A5J6TUH9_9CAUD|nr:minor tail protein [Gordonia phage Ranch]QFG12342.1 hypothetical protein PBI_RANCH_31 [Gordonia phage Ranch]